MTWPTVAITTTNLDAGTDSPATARADLLDGATKTNQMIAHVSAFAATVLDDANAATARATLAAAASGANADITSMTALVSVNNGPLAGFRNVVINGGFTVNQRVYASAGVLAAGAYGHDRWKAGAGGGDYSFTQLPTNTSITIAANKTLIQVIEDSNVQGTSYVVSWTGTAQGRVGVNSATPSGAYAASPILITGQTAGTTMSVEFGNGASAGTLGKVQVEAGTATPQATNFERRHYGLELALCQRYYWRTSPGASGVTLAAGHNSTTANNSVLVALPVTMRAPPSALEQSGAATDYQVLHGNTTTVCSSVPVFGDASAQTVRIAGTVASGLTTGQGSSLRTASVSGYLGFSAEL